MGASIRQRAKPRPCEQSQEYRYGARAVAGEPLTSDHLTIKRPGYGIPPKHLQDLIGRRPRQALQVDDVLTWEALQ